MPNLKQRLREIAEKQRASRPPLTETGSEPIRPEVQLERAAAVLLIALAIVQTILHYLGWLGILLGVVAFLFGNRERALELVIGGLGFLVLKYLVGFVVVSFLRLLQATLGKLRAWLSRR